MLAFETVRDFALALPGTDERLSYSTPAIFVRGKVFVRHLPDAEAFSLRADFFTRDVLIAQDPATFFTNPHWQNYPAVLIRLASADAGQIEELLLGSWRSLAGKRLLAAYDAQVSRQP